MDERLEGWFAQFKEDDGGPRTENIPISEWRQANVDITAYVNKDGVDVRLGEFEAMFDGWKFSAFVKDDVVSEGIPDPVNEYFANTPKLEF